LTWGREWEFRGNGGCASARGSACEKPRKEREGEALLELEESKEQERREA